MDSGVPQMAYFKDLDGYALMFITATLPKAGSLLGCLSCSGMAMSSELRDLG